MTGPDDRGRRLALIAALLGWMFDGMEMGLFPLVGKSALKDLLADATRVDVWFSVINAGFLVGAATGGVLFGWLGDRLGRVRAMTLAVLVYAGGSGLCALSQAPWQLATLRFAGALGMGGEWALGVALIMELYPGASRAKLAGLIGFFGNFGYLLLALISLALNRISGPLSEQLTAWGWGNAVGTGNWRLLMLVGAMPALLTFLIRLFVPESDKWEEEQKAGTTSQWSTVDLIGVLIGAAVGAGVLSIWLTKWDLSIRILGTLVGVVLITFCFLHPARQYMFRIGMPIAERRRTVRRLLLAAGLSGVPLVATWGGVMWVYNWVDELTRDPITKLITNPDAKPITQAASAFGAAMGCVLAAWLGNVIGRKPAYAILCVGSAVSLFSFYRFNTEFNVVFVVTAGLVGFVTASFYGWLPLYLPELFRTGMRATGQGFGFNFGRILASVGSLQTGALLQAFDGNYAKACSAAAAVYGLGLVLIAFAPETRGKPLPD